MLETRDRTARRLALLRRAAHLWCDADSDVRGRARVALCGQSWPPATVERALDDALRGFDAGVEAWLAGQPDVRGATCVAILPGNIIGPALNVAFCGAVAGARVLLKSAREERRLAELVVEQLATLDVTTGISVSAAYWSGGDAAIETDMFSRVERVIVFGSDEAVASITRRVPANVAVIAYPDACSIAFIAKGASFAAASEAVSWDIAMFDQRGCMSPQTIYVEGDEPGAIRFAQALHSALVRRDHDLPKATSSPKEAEALANVIRGLQVSALSPVTHALTTLHLGASCGQTPTFVIAVEPYSEPVSVGFGRVVVVKPCENELAFRRAARSLGGRLEAIGIASDAVMQLGDAGARRVCSLGEMQRPPFGYRPRIQDFVATR
ncbi:MAG: hypothetical protein M3Z37_06190 [Candidatus Eremiobacteraeota bacterium]|nr:hypothetical protein [Candidatus Eremiobacteraeota bacterium]